MLAVCGRRLQAKRGSKATNVARGVLPLLLGKLFLEALAHLLLALGKLDGNGLATLERLQYGTHIFDTHTREIFKEGDEGDQRLILRVTAPLVQNNCVLGLEASMFLLCVDEDDLRQITVQV